MTPVDQSQASYREILLRVPIAAVDDDACLPAHIEGRLTRPQAMGLLSLSIGLDGVGLRLANGRRPDRRIDAVRWLLEQIAAALDPPDKPDEAK